MKIWLNLFLKGIMVMLTVLLHSCQTKVATDLPADLLSNTVIPAMEAKDFESFVTDSSVVKYHLQTPKLLIFDDQKKPYKDFPEGFIVQKFDLNRKIISQLSANHGKYFDQEKKWEADGNVVLINSAGDTLKTEELRYHELEDLIFSEKFVSIKKGDQQIYGTGGFKSDSQMTRWSFMKTKGHIYVDSQ